MRRRAFVGGATHVGFGTHGRFTLVMWLKPGNRTTPVLHDRLQTALSRHRTIISNVRSGIPAKAALSPHIIPEAFEITVESALDKDGNHNGQRPVGSMPRHRGARGKALIDRAAESAT